VGKPLLWAGLLSELQALPSSLFHLQARIAAAWA